MCEYITSVSTVDAKYRIKAEFMICIYYTNLMWCYDCLFFKYNIIKIHFILKYKAIL